MGLDNWSGVSVLGSGVSMVCMVQSGDHSGTTESTWQVREDMLCANVQ